MYSLFVFSVSREFGFHPVLGRFNARPKNEIYPAHSRAKHRALFYNIASLAKNINEYITTG